MAENYRPVSLTCSISKVMESFVYQWLVDFLNKSCPLKQSQHGFQRRKSCETQLLEFMNDVTLALDRGECVDVIYLDLRKAFDLVCHFLLIEKLRRRGVPEVLINWIRAFLQNRVQRVVIHGSSSDDQLVLKGVPQGSVLGPLLFNIYVDDMEDVLIDGVCQKQFADDTKTYIHYYPAQAVQSHQKLQRSLDKIMAWCGDWQMQINVKKTAQFCILVSKIVICPIYVEQSGTFSLHHYP